MDNKSIGGGQEKCPVCLSAGRQSVMRNGTCPKCGLTVPPEPAPTRYEYEVPKCDSSSVTLPGGAQTPAIGEDGPAQRLAKPSQNKSVLADPSPQATQINEWEMDIPRNNKFENWPLETLPQAKAETPAKLVSDSTILHLPTACGNRYCAQHRDIWRHYEDHIASPAAPLSQPLAPEAREWLREQGWTDADTDNHRSHLWWIGQMDAYAAPLRQEVAELKRQLEKVEVERDKYDHALHSLTFGGSEFAHDAEACVKHVKERQHSQHQMIVRLTIEKRAAEASLTELKRQRDEALAESAELLWNLGGCDAIASGWSDSDLNPEISRRPALDAVCRMAKRLAAAEASLLTMKEALEKKRHGVYMASKTKHAEKWKALRSSGVPVICTWIDEAGVGETKSFSDLWTRCISEVASAEMLIAYAESGDELKGGLLEIGAALSAGTPVIVVGDVPQLKTAKHHPLISFAESVPAALAPSGAEKQ